MEHTHGSPESIPPVIEPTEHHEENAPRPQSSLASKLRGPKAIGIGAAAVASILAIWGASRFTRDPPPTPPPLPGIHVGDGNVELTADAPAWRVLRVAESKKAETHESDAFTARVKIDETRASKVGTPLPGRVTAVHVELGQKVKVGDPLFSVASPDIAGLRAERDKASVDVDVAKAALERVKAMVAASAVPAKDELYASQEYKQALVSMRLAQSKLASLKVSSRKDNEFTVVSPRDGFIVDKDVLPSQEVTADSSLVQVADLSKVWVVAELFEADAAGIAAGTKARITSPSVPGFEALADVSMVSAVVDPTRHTVGVRVELPNDDGKLRANIFAEMRFREPAPEGTVETEASALVSDGARQYVYVEAPKGKFSKREVVAGSARGGIVPIYKGLAAGERVVVEGAILLDNQIDMTR
jgi:RND family efflux transporter MFP subunit